ncbi:MAG: hypothetical protein JW945_01425 [Methanomicrobia archaeon]|nr:hypothetical protein [Methanomicrobia archaeon]
MGQPNSTRYAFVFIAVVLFLVALVGAVSADSTCWYLTSTDVNNHPWTECSISEPYEYMVMFKFNYSHNDVVIKDGTTYPNPVTWRANESAQVAVGFPADTWQLQIYEVTSGKEGTVNVSIGVWNGTECTWTTFTAYGTNASVYVSGSNQIINITASAFTVKPGEYLAVQIENVGNSEIELKKYPASDPSAVGRICTPFDTNYPVPELAIVVLFSAGLIALVGYVGYRKRT